MAKRPSQTWTIQRPKSDQAYLQALRLYWQGETEGAISSIVDQISEGQSQQNEFLYRLWIEILAQNNDDDALRTLSTHIQSHLESGLIDSRAGNALVALIHYELGEREAATIILRPLRKNGNEPFQRELTLLLEDDEELRTQAAQIMIRVSGDFFHLRRASLYFHASKDGKGFQRSLETIDEAFPSNPLRAEISFHQCFGAKNYERALDWATNLRNNFSINPEYQFFFAYCSYLTKNNEQALHEFLSLNRRLEGKDPDVLSLIGLTLLKSGTPSPSQVELSRKYLTRAKERLSALGLPTRYTEDLLMRMNPESQDRSGKYWMVKLTSRQAWELSQRSDDRVQTLHKSMGNFVGKGDLCFFITESQTKTPGKPSVWRLHALYEASSEPEWHPMHRWQTSLELVLRMEVAVPIEIEGSFSDSKHPAARFGLLEIDGSAIENLEECIQEFTLDDSAYTHVIEHLRIARAS